MTFSTIARAIFRCAILAAGLALAPTGAEATTYEYRIADEGTCLRDVKPIDVQCSFVFKFVLESDYFGQAHYNFGGGAGSAYEYSQTHLFPDLPPLGAFQSAMPNQLEIFIDGGLGWQLTFFHWTEAAFGGFCGGELCAQVDTDSSGNVTFMYFVYDVPYALNLFGDGKSYHFDLSEFRPLTNPEGDFTAWSFFAGGALGEANFSVAEIPLPAGGLPLAVALGSMLWWRRTRGRGMPGAVRG